MFTRTMILRCVGTLCLGAAVWGFGLFAAGVLGLSASQGEYTEAPLFTPLFLLLTSIYLLLYALLLVAGVGLLRLVCQARWILFGVLTAELIFFFGSSFLSGFVKPEHARSIGAATGLAAGGLLVQFATGFPVWGALAAYWASEEKATRIVSKRQAAGRTTLNIRHHSENCLQ